MSLINIGARTTIKGKGSRQWLVVVVVSIFHIELTTVVIIYVQNKYRSACFPWGFILAI